MKVTPLSVIPTVYEAFKTIYTALSFFFFGLMWARPKPAHWDMWDLFLVLFMVPVAAVPFITDWLLDRWWKQTLGKELNLCIIRMNEETILKMEAPGRVMHVEHLVEEAPVPPDQKEVN